MKRVLLLTLIGITFCCLYAGAYCINDPIGDRIGVSAFELYGIDVVQNGTQIDFSIYTNLPENGYLVDHPYYWVTDWQTLPADLAIDLGQDGFYEYGVALTAHDGLSQGGLYSVEDWYISDDYAPSSYYYRWNYGRIVSIEQGSPAGSVLDEISWDLSGVTGPIYEINFSLNAGDLLPSGFDGDVNIYFANATCANDYVYGSVHMSSVPVPEPATFILLGTGLLGLAGRNLRRKDAGSV